MEREEKICLFVILIIIIAIVGYVSYSYYQDYKAEKEAEEERSRLFVEEGDKITFEVTAWTEDNRIFYTTDQSVADDSSRLKTANFIFYSDEPDLSVVGEESTSKFNEGFTEQVLNMKIDQTDTFSVTPEKGYGWRNDSLVKEIPISDSIPLYVVQATSEFQMTYNPQDMQLHIGQRYTHTYWNWPIELVEVNNDTIFYRHSPALNWEITVLPWDAEVTGISEKDSLLYITHKPDQALLYESLDPLELTEYNPTFYEIQTIQSELQIGNIKGIIVEITGDHIKIDFNDERAGKYIYYEVTIIDIEKA
ncbi:MAG: FKBP-type peptidyl-prolyl cis-trans isomerase [Thermoplasmata archaeon]|nr:MAG: FKBP-type peptidyl-prolyl cis-trans isomerase [Thermoplasmata archaeon]